jgi:hypothetical protein
MEIETKSIKMILADGCISITVWALRRHQIQMKYKTYENI